MLLDLILFFLFFLCYSIFSYQIIRFSLSTGSFVLLFWEGGGNKESLDYLPLLERVPVLVRLKVGFLLVSCFYGINVVGSRHNSNYIFISFHLILLFSLGSLGSLGVAAIGREFVISPQMVSSWATCLCVRMFVQLRYCFMDVEAELRAYVHAYDGMGWDGMGLSLGTIPAE